MGLRDGREGVDRRELAKLKIYLYFSKWNEGLGLSGFVFVAVSFSVLGCVDSFIILRTEYPSTKC